MPKEDRISLDEALATLADSISASDVPIELSSFDNFVQDILSLSYPQYSFKSWHIRVVANFLDEVLASESKMAEVVLPRYHLKSTLCGYGFAIYQMLTSFGDGLYVSYKDELTSFHMGNIKEVVRVNSVLSKFMIDLNPRSESNISYRIGRKKVRIFGSGIFAMKRGLHTNSCITPDTKIYMAPDAHKKFGGGYQPISNIKVGDKVKTHLNRYQVVKRVYIRDICETIYSLYLNNGEIINITGNHPILTKLGWKIVSDLVQEDILMKLHFPVSKLKNRTYANIHGSKKGSALRKSRFIGLDRSKQNKPTKGKTWEEYFGIDTAKQMKEHASFVHLSEKVPIICPCGKIFYRNPKRAKNAKYCSIQCANKYKPANKGMGFNFRAKVDNFIGENNPNWKGGKSKLPLEPYDTKFDEDLKKSIRERDNYTCAQCGKRGWVVHHIDYDKKNTCVTNLITLCKKCHVKTNINNRVYWKNLFSAKIAEKYALVQNGTHILKIEKKEYSGKVWNLEIDKDETYCGKGIIFHNCVIGDDLLGTMENPMILTELEKAERMFNQEVINIPNKGCPLVVYGTTIDYSDLLFKLKDNPQFKVLWMPAINPDPHYEVLWEDKFDKKTLEMKKQQGGWKAFSSEFLLTPVVSLEAFFTREQLDKVIDKDLMNYRVPGW